jgi:DNA-binding NarL/FixJ family response regulator
VEARPDIKVIICSGYEIDAAAQSLLDAGASAFVSKPFQMSTLENEIRKALPG